MLVSSLNVLLLALTAEKQLHWQTGLNRFRWGSKTATGMLDVGTVVIWSDNLAQFSDKQLFSPPCCILVKGHSTWTRYF